MTRPLKLIPRPWSDLILWDETLETLERLRDFKIGVEVDNSTRHLILSTVKSNCDSFYELWVSRHVFYFKFCIDTGDSPPVYYS